MLDMKSFCGKYSLEEDWLLLSIGTAVEKFYEFKKTATIIFSGKVVASSEEKAHSKLVQEDFDWKVDNVRELITRLDDNIESMVSEVLSSPTSDGLHPIIKHWEALLEQLTQRKQEHSGGLWTPPGNRLLLLALALSMNAKDILELGYDSAVTTMALALSGARVTGVDNLSEHPLTENVAKTRMRAFPNVTLVNSDALGFLTAANDESYDLIFVDDSHDKYHVALEAIQISRVLRHGGLVAFHDTLSRELWDIVDKSYPDVWQRIHFPSLQENGEDFGLGIFKRPL